MFCGILVNWKLLRNMRDDDKDQGPNSNGIVIRDVMATHAKTQMVVWPTLWVLFWMIHQDVDIPTWLHPCFCYIKIVAYLFRIYFAFNSLVVAAMRYTFIVYNKTVTSLGIAKSKALFYYGSLLIPLTIAILSELTIDVPTEVGGKAFALCKKSPYNIINNVNTSNNALDSLNSPIFDLFHQYVPNNVIYYHGLFVKLCLWIIFGNLLEGILYWKTFGSFSR